MLLSLVIVYLIVDIRGFYCIAIVFYGDGVEGCCRSNHWINDLIALSRCQVSISTTYRIETLLQLHLALSDPISDAA